MLTPDEVRAIDHEIEIVPERRAACLEALQVVQRSRGGWVDDDALADVATYLGMSTAELDSVATFYNLIHRRPVGRHVIHVCDSVSCWLMGFDAVRARLSEGLGIGFGETTDDERFTLLPIQCLGTCDHAPALMVGEDLHRDLRPEALDAILERYE
jgi:NADH-quinone oxidoreductase subunit E